MGITFTNPWAILLLFIPLFFCFHVWLRKGHSVTLPIDHADVKSSSWLYILIGFAEMLPALVVVCLIMILAGPKIKGQPKDEKVMKNILFCLDSSGSMNAPFGSKRRYDVAMEAINKFTTYREGDSFGLTVFGTEYLNWIPVTQDTSCLNNSTPFLDPMKMPRWFGGSTYMGKGLRGCLDVLKEKEEGDKMIIVVSDGASSDDVNGPASELKAAGITVFCVYIGGGSPPMELYTLAGSTGGKVFSSNDKVGLDNCFKQIDKMQSSNFKKTTPQDVDFYKPFCIVGLSTLGLYLLTLFGLRFTPW